MKIIAPLSFVSDKEEFSFVWIQFHQHPGLNRRQERLESIQCYSNVAQWKGHIHLAIISLEVVRDSMS